MNQRKLAVAAAIVLVAPMATACAETSAEDSAASTPVQEKRPALTRLLKSADANADQKLDLAEIHTKLPDFPQERFNTLDKNQDGALEASELPVRPEGAAGGAGPRGEGGQKLRAADTDQDGKLSQAEFSAAFPNAPAERFAAMDRNADGFVDRTDREAAGTPGDAGAQPGRPARGAEGARGEIGQKLRAADTDQDGKLSQAEFSAGFPGASVERFAAMDRNSDGFVDQTDREAAAARGTKKEAKEGGKKKHAAHAETGPYLEQLILAHDADKDGKLTKVELEAGKPGFPEKTFTAMDRDKDGNLSAADAAPAGQ